MKKVYGDYPSSKAVWHQEVKSTSLTNWAEVKQASAKHVLAVVLIKNIFETFLMCTLNSGTRNHPYSSRSTSRGDFLHFQGRTSLIMHLPPVVSPGSLRMTLKAISTALSKLTN
ncbi:hypothetical protein GWI33_021175 [Rhynchophorus ferrugineus]|uniref:Uncharacterized protein n=1 Tax=Rhynchophorus ferrugineus TaxID=354439 RepID=A0A834M520_RHYFE|nr:hypothetical protein GWI33_021175 [Rhynchophorus ferrugineus]